MAALIIHLAMVGAICMTGAACWAISCVFSAHRAYLRGYRDAQRAAARVLAAERAMAALEDTGQAAPIPGQDALPGL